MAFKIGIAIMNTTIRIEFPRRLDMNSKLLHFPSKHVWNEHINHALRPTTFYMHVIRVYS